MKDEIDEKHEFLRHVADASPAIIYVLDLQQRKFIYINATVKELLGYDKEYVLQAGAELLKEIVLPGEYSACARHISSLSEMGDTEIRKLQVRLKVNDKDYRWFRVSDRIFKRDKNGKATQSIGIAHDINKEKLAREEAASTRNLLQSVFDSAIIHIVYMKAVRDEHHKIVDFEYVLVNPVVLKHYGNSPAGKRYIDLSPENGGKELFARYKELVETGKKMDIEVSNTVNGVNKWFHIVAVKMGDGFVATTDDITEQKNAQAQIKKAGEAIEVLNNQLLMKNRQLEALNSELKTFTTIAANDYNETLRNLYTNLEHVIVQDAANLSNGSRANLRRAQASIQKMKLLTEDIVSYAKLHEIETGKQNVSLNEIINNVIRDIERKLHETNIKVDCADMPDVTGYPFLISLVFYHLIDNAIKFRNEDGPLIHITCEEGVRNTDFLSGSAAHKATFNVVSVKDNGIGFHHADAERLFNIFYKQHNENKHKGSGIGLAICKKIMELHGGFIMADGQPGKGAAFHCYFPVE